MDAPNVPSSAPKPDLFSKIGPLPAWGWGAIAVVGYLLYRRYSAMRAPIAVTDPANVVTDASTPASDSWGSSSGGGGGGASPVGPESSGYNYTDVLAGSYTGTTSGAVFDTNQQWGVYSINNLPKLGFPAGEVASAITFYLAGMPLTANQRAIVERAIGSYGSPPLPQPLNDGPVTLPATTETVNPVVTPPAPTVTVIPTPRTVVPPAASAAPKPAVVDSQTDYRTYVNQPNGLNTPWSSDVPYFPTAMDMVKYPGVANPFVDTPPDYIRNDPNFHGHAQDIGDGTLIWAY